MDITWTQIIAGLAIVIVEVVGYFWAKRRGAKPGLSLIDHFILTTEMLSASGKGQVGRTVKKTQAKVLAKSGDEKAQKLLDDRLEFWGVYGLSEAVVEELRGNSDDYKDIKKNRIDVLTQMLKDGHGGKK